MRAALKVFKQQNVKEMMRTTTSDGTSVYGEISGPEVSSFAAAGVGVLQGGLMDAASSDVRDRRANTYPHK